MTARASSETRQPDSRRLARLDVALLLLGWVLLWFCEPHQNEADGFIRFQALRQLLESGTWSSSEFPLLGTLLAAPLYLLGRLLETPAWWVARYNLVLFGLGLVALWRLLGPRVSSDVLRAFLLLTLAGSMMTHQLSAFGAETFNVVALAVGLAAWTGGHFLLGGIALALGMANVPATAVGVALALGDWAWTNRRWRAVLPLVGFAALWLGENWLRRGQPLLTGYAGNAGYHTVLPYSGRPGFSYPLFFGVLQLLLSFGKGLLFFAPGLFLWFPAARRALRAVRPFQRACLWVVVGLVLVYGQWWAWYGGYSWGPRFLVFAAIPASLRLAAEVNQPPRRLLPLLCVLGALLLSLWGGFTGATFRFWHQDVCTQINYTLEALCWDVPEFSVLWTPFAWPRPLAGNEWALFAYAVVLAIRFGARPALALVRVLRRRASATARIWREEPRLRW